MADPQIVSIAARPHQAVASRRVLPYALLALCMFFWASNWIVGRAFHDTVPPIALNFWRWTTASVLLLPFSWRQVLASWPAIRRHWLLMVVFGFAGAGAFHALIYTGLRHTEAINALLLNSAIPVFIICLSWVWYRETITLRQAAGIILSFVGVFVIISRGDPATLLHLKINRGDVFIFLALPIWAFYSVLLKKRPAGIGDLAFLQVIGVVSVVASLPFYIWEMASGEHMTHVDAATVSAIVYIAVVASILGYIFWNYAVAKVGANMAGHTSHLMPAFGAAMAILILGEHAYLFHAIGIALILGGVLLSTTARTAVRSAA
ncbi:MAG TPA: DMT family transporter [Candidatus Cybelea sp.]|nr:DMT family transporter [Candidatus Cybelea sp.]